MSNNLRRIWEARKIEKGVTQTQAAKELGWTQGALAQYLNGHTDLNGPAIIKLANYLGVDPRDIDPRATNHMPRILNKVSKITNAKGENVRLPSGFTIHLDD